MKALRHDMILEIIKTKHETQEDLAKALRPGTSCTQPPYPGHHGVRLVKTCPPRACINTRRWIGGNRASRTAFHGYSASPPCPSTARAIGWSQDHQRAANAPARRLDAMKWPGIDGTIAGDNTLLVIAKSVSGVERLSDRFKAMVRG